MNAMFSFSLGESRRGAPKPRPGRKRRFAAAIAEAALAEVLKNRRRVIEEGVIDMTKRYQTNPQEGSQEAVFAEG